MNGESAFGWFKVFVALALLVAAAIIIWKLLDALGALSDKIKNLFGGMKETASEAIDKAKNATTQAVSVTPIGIAYNLGTTGGEWLKKKLSPPVSPYAINPRDRN